MSGAESLDPSFVDGLRRLKLASIRRLASKVCATARTLRWRPEEFLRVLVDEECKARDESNRQARLKAAAFPVHKTLDSFDLSVSSLTRASSDYLSSLDCLRDKRNVALVGPPGTGKSHSPWPSAAPPSSLTARPLLPGRRPGRAALPRHGRQLRQPSH